MSVEKPVLIKYRGDSLLLTENEVAELYEASVGLSLKTSRLEKELKKKDEEIAELNDAIEKKNKVINIYWELSEKNKSEIAELNKGIKEGLEQILSRYSKEDYDNACFLAQKYFKGNEQLQKENAELEGALREIYNLGGCPNQVYVTAKEALNTKEKVE